MRRFPGRVKIKVERCCKIRSHMAVDWEYENGKPTGRGRARWVSRGATYPYSSVRQEERNRRRYNMEGRSA